MGNEQGNLQSPTSSKSVLIADVDTDIERIKATINKLFPNEQVEITEQNFQEKLFSVVPKLGSHLYGKIYKDEHTISKGDIIQLGKDILDLHLLEAQMEFYIYLFSRSKSSLSKEECSLLLDVIYQSACGCAGLDASLEFSMSPVYSSVIKAMFNQEEVLSINDFIYWVMRHSRQMFESIHSYTRSVFLGEACVIRNAHNEGTSCSSQEQTFTQRLSGCVLTQSLAWMLSCQLPPIFFPNIEVGDTLITHILPLLGIVHVDGWHLLYSSTHHGLSVNRFGHHVFSYKAPTVMLIEFQDHLYVLTVDQEWREDHQRWGGKDCVLIEVLPTYKQMMAGDGMLYLNTQDRSAKKGLIIGKDARTTFLEINEDFSKVTHFGVQVPLEHVEVWGCGGSLARSNQQSQKKWEHKEAEKAKTRKLKLDDWRDNPDKELLNMGGVTTEHAQR